MRGVGYTLALVALAATPVQAQRLGCLSPVQTGDAFDESRVEDIGGSPVVRTTARTTVWGMDVDVGGEVRPIVVVEAKAQLMTPGFEAVLRRQFLYDASGDYRPGWTGLQFNIDGDAWLTMSDSLARCYVTVGLFETAFAVELTASDGSRHLADERSYGATLTPGEGQTPSGLVPASMAEALTHGRPVQGVVRAIILNPESNPCPSMPLNAPGDLSAPYQLSVEFHSPPPIQFADLSLIDPARYAGLARSHMEARAAGRCEFTAAGVRDGSGEIYPSGW